MNVMQFLLNSEGKLFYITSVPIPFSFTLGAYLVGESLVVSPRVKSVESSFNGRLGFNHNLVKGKFVKEYSSYRSVVFTSSVSIKLSRLLKSQVEMVVFLEDVDELIMDVRLIKKRMPVIGLISRRNWKIETFCKENGLRCIDINRFNCSDLSDLKGKWKKW